MTRSNQKPPGNQVWTAREANVSTLKVHLGRFLKRIRGGEEVVVLDRNQPVAKLVPYSGKEEKPALSTPTLSWQELEDHFRKSQLKQPTQLKKSSLFYLNQDREGRR